jgi:hypothetical protein
MAGFVSEPGIWPICGWESRSALDVVLRQFDLKKKFDNRCRNHLSALKAKGLEPTTRQVLEDCIRWIGAGDGPGKFKPGSKEQGAPVKRQKLKLRDDIEWAYVHLGSTPGKEGIPPSTGATSLLEWARGNPDDFIRHVWSKLLPRVEAEKPEAERYHDDGRPLSNLDNMIREKLRELSEGASGEPGVPAVAESKGARIGRVPGGVVE